MHDRTASTTKRLIIYQIALTSTGTRDTSKLTSAGVSVFYTQLFSSSAIPPGTVPSIPGFASRLDTGVLTMVDEQEGRVLVFLCSAYSTLSSICASSPMSTLYSTNATRYKDVEFVGRVPTAAAVLDPLTAPSKLFLTSTAESSGWRAELYVQCARCQGGGITLADSEALSPEDCFCMPGYMIVTAGSKRGCELCKCRDGQFLDVQQGAGCITGKFYSHVADENDIPLTIQKTQGASSRCPDACPAPPPAPLDNTCKAAATARRPETP